MASIGFLIGGALINALAFSGSNILFSSLSSSRTRSFAGSHWQPKEVIGDLAEVIKKVTRARLFFEEVGRTLSLK